MFFQDVLFLAPCSPIVAVAGCFSEEPTVWETIERMTLDQLLGTAILVGLLIASTTVGGLRLRAIVRAIKQTRAYESRALTALFYNRPEEAVSACQLFPKSPVACVVAASLQSPQSFFLLAGEYAKLSKPAFRRAVVAQTVALKRSLWLLAAFGWSSPVVGLATTLAPSVRYGSERPLPFLFGLLIAVPAVWLHRGLSSEVEALVLETDRVSLSILDQITKPIQKSHDRMPRLLRRETIRHFALPPTVE